MLIYVQTRRQADSNLASLLQQRSCELNDGGEEPKRAEFVGVPVINERDARDDDGFHQPQRGEPFRFQLELQASRVDDQRSNGTADYWLYVRRIVVGSHGQLIACNAVQHAPLHVRLRLTTLDSSNQPKTTTTRITGDSLTAGPAEQTTIET